MRGEYAQGFDHVRQRRPPTGLDIEVRRRIDAGVKQVNERGCVSP